MEKSNNPVPTHLVKSEQVQTALDMKLTAIIERATSVRHPSIKVARLIDRLNGSAKEEDMMKRIGSMEVAKPNWDNLSIISKLDYIIDVLELSLGMQDDMNCLVNELSELI